MKGFILDSYALIAYMEDEPGAMKVVRLLDKAEKRELSVVMSIVNWGEVYYSIFRAKGEVKAEESLLIIEQLPLKIIEEDRRIMYEVAKLKANYSIALGDCFAAAVALKMNFPVVTGDKEFKKLKGKVKIEWI